MLVVHGNAFTGEAFQPDCCVRIENGAVTAVGGSLTPLPHEQVLDLEGDYLLPGFVDVHIHAFLGSDAMEGEEAVRAMSRALFDQGVAAFCPTTMSASEADTRRALRGIRAVMARPEPQGARVLGAHMEAPFLQKEKAGAQRKEFLSAPAWDAFERMTEGCFQAVRLITVAPELPGSEQFIRKACKSGIRVSVGHSAATAEQLHLAGDWGADHVTHIFNAQTPLHHRRPGVPGAALADGRFFCEMICDGVHLHRDVVRLIAQCKGKMAVAITDAMEAAGMPDGQYALGGQKVFVRRGEARLENGALAGSVLTMPKALENLIHLFGIDPALACAMCTSSPASSLGEAPLGRMAVGSPAPLTRWSKDWKLLSVIKGA